MQLTPDDAPPPDPKPANSKVTARMLRIRELIDAGVYPDRDELAERITERITEAKVTP